MLWNRIRLVCPGLFNSVCEYGALLSECKSFLIEVCAVSGSTRMTVGFKGLLLLSVTVVVWTVPIDRNAEPPQEEKLEENAVRLETHFPTKTLFCSLIYFWRMFRHRIPVCTMIATWERWSKCWKQTLTSEKNSRQPTPMTLRLATPSIAFVLF